MKDPRPSSHKNRFQTVLLAVVLATCGNPVCIFAQNPTTDPEARLSQYDRIMNLIRRSEFKQAELGIDALLKANVDDHEAHMLRKALGNALVSRNRRNSADLQYEKFLEYVVSGRKQSRPLLRQIPQILTNIRYVRNNEEPKASEMLDRVCKIATDAIADEPNNEGYSIALSTAIQFKAQGLSKQGKYDEMQAIYSTELQRLRSRWQQEQDNSEVWLRLFYFMKAAATPDHPSYQAFAEKLQVESRNLLNLAVEKFPHSSKVVDEFVREKLKEIEALRQPSPDGAMQSLVELQNQMNNLYARNPRGLMTAKMKVDKAHQVLLRQINRDALVGAPLPKIESLVWLNGAEDVLQVPPRLTTVLVFLSTGEDSSIPQIVKLNELAKNNADEFQLVVAVSDYQESFRRLASIKKRPPRDLEENKQRYRDHLKNNLIKAKGLSCPICIATDAGETANRLGIDALPFLVLIDKSGICRQVESRTIDSDKLMFTIEGLVGK